MAVWFSASAVVPALASQWHLSDGAAAWMTAPVQAGFVLGAVGSAVLGLADRIRPHLLVAGCAAGAAGCTLLMALFADGLPAAVPLRFATGAFLAGVYPVCMKLMASWSPPAGRALAMGALIGCLALGSALPHLIDGLGRLNWRAVLTAAAATAFCAAIVAGALVRPGPQFPAGGGTGRRRYALAMFSDRGPRLVSLAYFGHMWELYALWTWLPTFLIVSRTTTTGLPAPGASGIDAFLAIGVAGLPALAAVLHRGPPVAARLHHGVGRGGHRRLRRVLHHAQRSGRPALPRHRADHPDGHRLPADHRHDPGDSADRRRHRLALRLPGPRGRAHDRAARPDRPDPRYETERPGIYLYGKDTVMTSCWPSGPPAIGTTAELSRTIGPDDIDRFTDISGDRNPLHYDLAAARASRFGEIVVQGGITSAILNAVVAERLPGPGTVFLNVNWDFKAPVRPGDVITGRVEVIEARADKPVTKLRTTVTRGDGTVALDGTAVCYTMAITAERHQRG
jgi:acyl dehydratase